MNRIFLTLFLLLFAGSIYADDDDRDVEWSYLHGSSLEYDLNASGIGIEPDGYKFGLSLGFGDHIFGVIDRSSTDNSVAGLKYDFDTAGYGFGYHWDSWYASYTYNTWDLNNNKFDVDTIRVGFRDMWSDHFEFSASYTWNDIDGAENEDGYQIGFAYELWDDFNLTANWETVGGMLNMDAVMFGIRFDF